MQQVVTPYGQSQIVTDYTYYQNSQSKNSQLLQSDGIYTYNWDNNGNLETKGATNYIWDYDDRLVGINSPTVNASYVYDYLGSRVRKTADGIESIYLYNDEDIVKEITGGIDTSYLHGIGIDEPVMMDRAGAKYYYFKDGLGSIREMTDSGGTVQNSYNYGAWGEVRNQSGVVQNSYGYTGREFSEDGLYFYRARYLNPTFGRFISEDPLGFVTGVNFFSYVKNNPIEWIDPLGYWCITIGKYPKKISPKLSEPITDFETTWHLVGNKILAATGGALPTLFCIWERRRQVRWAVTWIFEMVKVQFCCCGRAGCYFIETPYAIVKEKEIVRMEKDIQAISRPVAFESEMLAKLLCLSTDPNRGDVKLK